MKPIVPLTIAQCWKMVYRVDTWAKMTIAELWLLAADITEEEFDDLMRYLLWIGRELARH